MNKSLLCMDCGEAEAVVLRYNIRFFQEIGSVAYTDPSLICAGCYRKNNKCREPKTRFVSFGTLGTWSKEKVGYLLSRKGKEANHLDNKFWRKRIWQIVALTMSRRARHG